MQIKATIDGVEQEFEVTGYGRFPAVRDTHYLDSEAGVVAVPPNAPGMALHLRLIRPRHTFGGVVFEETGERRRGQAGEWFLALGSIGCVVVGTALEYSILRVVGFEGGCCEETK